MTPIKINDKIETGTSFKIAEFRKDIRKTKPHKHNKYIELVYFIEGKGDHTIDNNKIKIEPSILFVVRKEQVHFWNIETVPSGYVILLKKSFVENSMDKDMQQLIFKISKYPFLFPKDKDTIESLFAILLKEYNSFKKDNTIVIEGLFKVLLAKLCQSENKTIANRQTLYHKYIELLTIEKLDSARVEDYAISLNTTPQNLNNICRKEANISASTILSKFIISEAKRLLWYSNLSIQEISYSLPFKDNSHFSKFFKRTVGKTPSEFRANHKSVPQ